MEQMKKQADKIELIRHKIEDAGCCMISAGRTFHGRIYLVAIALKVFFRFWRAMASPICIPSSFYDDYATLEEYWAYWSRYIYINRYQDVENGISFIAENKR